jgi:hypothetical protein
MAIFTSVFESTTDDIIDVELENADFDDQNFDEADTFDDTITEYCREMYAMDAAMYIMDVQLETAVYEGASDVEAMAENAITDFFAKIKEKIVDLYNKVKTWIRDKITHIRVAFATSATFMKKHGGEVKSRFDKNGGEWKYTGYDYSGYPHLDATWGVYKKIDESIDDAIKTQADSGDNDMSMLIDEIGKALKIDRSVTNIGELGAALADKVRGTYVTDNHPTGETVTGWVKKCQEAEKAVKEIQKSGDETHARMKKAIAGVNELEKTAKKNDKSAEASSLHAKAKFLAQAMAVTSKITTYRVNLEIEMVKAMASRCKSIYNLKDKKDEKKDENVSASYIPNLFESAFNLI